MDDTDDAATRYPWLKPAKPSWMRDGNGKEEDGDDDDDDDDDSVEIQGTYEDGAETKRDKDGDKEDAGDKEDDKGKDEDEDMKDAYHAEIVDDAKPNGTAAAKVHGESTMTLPEQ